jgi:excisionase family DNA binding protein
MDPKRLYTLAEITDALGLRDSLQDQIDELKHRLTALSAQIAEIKAPREHMIATGSKVFLSRKEAAAVLSISLRILEQLIVQGEIKTRHLGKRVLVQREQLDRLTKRDIKIIWPAKRDGK